MSRKNSGFAADLAAGGALRRTCDMRDGLADFAFAMQGLGSGTISVASVP